MIDLTATYTITDGPEAGTVINAKVRTRERDGATITSVRGIAALLADRIDAIADPGDRFHTLAHLGGATIAISDTDTQVTTNMISSRDNGRIRTTYQGTRALPVDVVLDLAEQIREQLSSTTTAPTST
ncbi:hypothetical protein [Streptomyces sp. NBC_01237]|uniref:hypothetical protein n=1 Tax=Streptomyces sp. NBC_01237 TaxID=2903790 RepID=UPI002DDC5384|nr:hypothetical protein [Streptomyces sp. NBC_01237]WRZ77290.1 hypothetical protein OG251_37180 [Streptomyces sp. NBC_01237]